MRRVVIRGAGLGRLCGLEWCIGRWRSVGVGCPCIGDVTGDGVVDVVYSTVLGSTIGVIDGQSLTTVRRFAAFSPNYTKPVNLAVGDIDGDGTGDIVVAPASTGTSPLVRAFSGKDGSLLFSRLAYAASFTGGVSVAAGDLTGDGKAEIIENVEVVRYSVHGLKNGLKCRRRCRIVEVDKWARRSTEDGYLFGDAGEEGAKGRIVHQHILTKA